MKVDHVAAELGLSAPTVYRFETGTSVPRPPDVEALCRLYGVNGDVSQALTALAKEAETPGWWHSYNGGIPRWFSVFVSLESEASHLRVFDSDLITGVLQTRAYAEAMYEDVEPSTATSEREQVISVRMHRQKILERRHPPKLDVILGESALCRSFGDTAVMAEQMDKLDAVSRLPHVSIRVVPIKQAHAALAAGTRFILLRFPEERFGEPPHVYAETLTGALYLDKLPEVKAYERVWESTQASALPPAESREMINHYRGEYES